MSELMDMYRELVVKNGNEVAMSEPPCVIWKADHPDCTGCPYELGCGKMLALGLVSMQSLFYKPNSYDDFQKMHHSIFKLQEMVLKAMTVAELRSIPIV